MEIATILCLLISTGTFYRKIIRAPNRTVTVVKLLVIIVASLLPGFALVDWLWSQALSGSKDSPSNQQAENDVSIFVLFNGMGAAMFAFLVVDLQQPWKALVRNMAWVSVLIFIMIQGVLMYVSGQLRILVTRQHLFFVVFKAPFIIARYILAMPEHGLGQFWGMVGVELTRRQ